jgi:hypothetical protein
MTPAQPVEDDRYNMKGFQNLIGIFNDKLVFEKTSRYNIEPTDDTMIGNSNSEELLGGLKDREIVDASLLGECDLRRSIQNSFKKKLLRRNLKENGRANLSE